MKSSWWYASRSVAIVGAAGVALGLLTPITASAAATDVVISELMYNPISDDGRDEFLELANTSSSAVDLSGWSTSGVSITFPSGTTIPGNGFLVISPDATRYGQTYGGTPDGIYTGGLSNGGEKITLKDAGGTVIDSVTYSDRAPWAGTPDGEGASLELIDPSATHDDYLNWAGSTATRGYTPRAANSVRHSGLGPRITSVSASPTSPGVNQPVTVTATVTGQTSATLLYRTDFAAEQSIPLQAVGDDVYSATIPGAAAGHLIRYRVRATNANATSLVPRADDTAVYQGVVVPSGVSSPIPMLEWFISDSDYNAITGNPTADIERKAAIAFNGTVVDNVTVNIRGAASQTNPKPNWKFELPHNYDVDFGLVEPIDEFAMQGDWSDRSQGRPLVSWDAYRRAGVVNTQVFPMRTQRNAQFLGLYTYIDLFDGTWRDREGYSDQQFFKAETGAFSENRALEKRWEKKNPSDEDFAPLRSMVAGVELSGTARTNYMAANMDIPQLINYAAVTAILEHVDSSSKNFYVAQSPTTGRWTIVPWDLDHTLGSGCCQVNSTFVTPAEPGDKTNDIMAGLLANPDWKTMYFRRLRTLVDDLLAPGRMEAVYDANLGPAAPVSNLDFAAWPYPGSWTYAKARSSLFNDIQARRNVFASDNRVPSAQPGTPNIVINEIQHSPVAGSSAQFIELYNPSSQAIDLSGWTMSGGLDLTIQPGTVILPGGAMTFVKDDPTFRATYGSTVFVGGRFDGTLGADGTVTLSRANGSTADTVTYGGAGWPQAVGGPSLELLNPLADNDNPSNWAVSQSTGGSPGQGNGSVVLTVPRAPGIGTAVAANASATVNWTVPASDGGSPITGYQVRVLESVSNQQVGALRPASASATSLLVTGLTNQTSYRFQVLASNTIGNSPFSSSSNIVTPAAAVNTPGPPVIGTPAQGAAGGKLSAIARWTPPSSQGGSPITGHQVVALHMSSSAPDALVLDSTTSRVLGPKVKQYDFTLSSGNYRFQVFAINAGGPGALSAVSTNVVTR